MDHIKRLKLVAKETILDIKKLSFKSETTDFDFKEVFKISDAKSKTEFIKDVCAFANTKGGYIIYGVNNDSIWIGLDDRSDSKIDDADIANIIDEYVDGDIEFLINLVEIEGNYYLAIYIFQSNSILPFKKDGQYSKQDWKTRKSSNTCVFKKGDVYCRRHSRSIKADNLFYTLKRNNFNTIVNIFDGYTIYNEFIGRTEYLNELYKKIKQDNNRIIQIDGIGGIGKTSFVHHFCKLLLTNEAYVNDFEFIIWTSAKQNKYTPTGIKVITDYISNYLELINDIYRFIIHNNLLDENCNDDTEDVVINFLKNNKVLLVIDNLETLNDSDLSNFLERFPNNSKAILTTRETLGDFFLVRLNLLGFEEKKEFPDFLNSQYKWFSNASSRSFTELYYQYLPELYAYTKGMPLAGQLIAYQISQGTSIELVIKNLKTGKAYEDILEFCFKGSIDKLTKEEQIIIYIISLSEKDDLFTLDDLSYISDLSKDDIGLNILPKLNKISLSYSAQTDAGDIGYGIPHLAKLFIKQYSQNIDEKGIIEKYEKFLTEKHSLLSNNYNNEQLFSRSNAKNHKERLAAVASMKALAVANYDYDSAIESMNKLISGNRKFAFLYLIKGKIEENSQFSDAYQRAKKDFELAINIDNTYIDPYIELGFLELKNRQKSNECLLKAFKNFDKALKLNGTNHQAHLGMAQYYSAKARKLITENKMKYANIANDHFEKAYYKNGQLTPTQCHSNAINAYNHAWNIRKNLRDLKPALAICIVGLEYEPRNSMLNALKSQIEDALALKEDPTSFRKKRFEEKGWKVTSL